MPSENINVRVGKLEAGVNALTKTVDTFVRSQEESNKEVVKTFNELRAIIAQSNAPNWKQWGIYITVIIALGTALWKPQYDKIEGMITRIDKFEERERELNNKIIELQIKESKKCITPKAKAELISAAVNTNSKTKTSQLPLEP